MGTAAETMPSWRTIESVVASACRAPSLHNSQPWRWVLEPEGLTLSSDPDRILPATDSFGRQMVVSCGAALNHLKYALLEHHWDSVIERMPHSANRECLATVAFTPTAEVSESEISMQRRSHAGTPSGYRCLHLPHGTTPWRRSPNSPNAQEHTWKTSEIAHDPHSSNVTSPPRSTPREPGVPSRAALVGRARTVSRRDSVGGATSRATGNCPGRTRVPSRHCHV